MSVANGAYTRTNSFGVDGARVIPRFFVDDVADELASAREGRPIFRQEERVEIILPGNPHTKPVQRVTDEHRQKWPKEYEAFKKGHEMAVEGTPIEQWPILKRGMVLELKALDLNTVEQLAAMGDLVCQRIGMGGPRIRVLAQAYLDEAKAGALLAQATAESEKRDAENADLRRKVEELSGLLNQVHAELQTLKNAPSPVASVIPGMLDPVEQMKGAPAPTGGSSLDGLANLGGKRKRG